MSSALHLCLFVSVFCLCVYRSYALYSLTAIQLSRLRELQFSYGCRVTVVREDAVAYHVPWFCVKWWQCIMWSGGSYNTYTNTSTINGPREKACNARRYVDDDDTCCFGPNLREFTGIGSWAQLGLEANEDLGKALDTFTTKMAIEGMSTVERDLFRLYTICAVKPKGGEEGFTLYSVWFCVQRRLCNQTRPGYEPEPQEHNFCEGNPLVEFSISDYFQGPQVCCNVLGLEVPGVDSVHLRLKIKSIPTYAKYVPGFRSTLQCEMYSRYACVGVHDVCPYRVLRRTPEAYPMDAYHQALIGVLKRTLHVFYCQGTLVSRYFILSAADCSTYDSTLANIAVVGDFKLRSINEMYSDELITYIIEHHAQRHYTTYRTNRPRLPPREHFDKEIVLFKVWRPIVFTPFRRPACINYQVEYKLVGWNKEGSGLFTGYGSVEPGKGMNVTVKRYLMQKFNSSSRECYRYRSLYLEREPQALTNKGVDFCATYINETYRDHYNELKVDLDKPWGPCEYDLGGPFLILMTVPYCQFLVLGVMTIARSKYCFALTTPYRFRSIEPLRKWLENTIYKDDFYLYDFDFSWPPCDRLNYQFHNATYMGRKHNVFAWKRNEEP